MPLTAAAPAVPVRRLLSRLAADERGVQFIEFAFMLPVLFLTGGYGVEMSNVALVNLRVSQYALNLADNASRVGIDAGAGVTQMREVDANDVLQGARLEGDAINLTTNGRVTLSSLEKVRQDYDSGNGDPPQRIHWQRCIGLKSGVGYDSSYGTTGTAAGTDKGSAYKGSDAATGMGDAGSKVSAPKDGGTMFVEINYDYQPLFGTLFTSARRIHYVASFVVRDNRDFAQIYNPDPAATRSTCNLYTKGVAGVAT